MSKKKSITPSSTPTRHYTYLPHPLGVWYFVSSLTHQPYTQKPRPKSTSNIPHKQPLTDQTVSNPPPTPPPSPLSTTTMSILQTHGVVVYQLLTAEETVAHRAAVLSAVKAAPELINPAPTATTQSLGAFGALGTPSSQNNVAVRNLRKLAHARTVRSVWRACAGGRNLEQLVDRLCVRTQKQPKE